VTKPGDAHSEAIRKKVKDWFTTTVLSRLDKPKDDAIVIVAQRLHVDDLIGYLLEQGGWEHLNLPAIATEDQRIPITDRHVWTRWKGDILQPERVGKAELAQLNKELGGANFEAQYQQNPAPPGGNFIKIEWFPRFDGADLNGYEMIIQSWDTAYGVEETHDYSVCTTWGLRADRIDLINVFRRQLAFPDLRKAVLRMHKQFKADIVIVEHAGSGVSLYQDLRAQGCGWIYTLSPDRDKVTRLAHQAAKIEQGLVALPKQAPWLLPFEQEVAAFPYGKHDDQVDSMSQLLRALDYRKSLLMGLSIYRSPKWLWAAAQSSNEGH
jgi:predicted phage terminase large subunit-like protein